MHLHVDSVDLIGGEVVFTPELNAAVNRGMNDDAAGERLVRIQGDFKRLTELLRDLRVVSLRAEDVCPAGFGLDTMVRAGEVLRRQKCRSQAILGGSARMIALRYGAEHLAQSYR